VLFRSMFGLNLADFAAARREIAANPALLPDAIEESLRYNTSGQRFKRSIIRETTLHGQTMRPGDFVCMAYGSGNRDERAFPQPDVYDIHRKPRGHLGYGGGVHACLGAMVARMAVKIIFEEFLQAFPEFSRAKHELPWMPSSTFRSPLQLQLTMH
jgi:cytochrome P450